MNLDEKEEYKRFLKIFGSLSGLFKDNKEGINATKPYLYYRNHEHLYSKVFDVEDLTRKDSAFDAIAFVNGKRIGVGLKTWIHTKDLTFQKVAEFNKAAPTELAPLIKENESKKLIKKVAELRNERMKLDQRQYNTNYDLYHNITRDDNVMNIMEENYDLIQLDNIKLKKRQEGTYTFTDGLNTYKFYASKSVLLKEFDASANKIIEKIPIIQYDDPFELLRTIELPTKDEVKNQEVIYLPLYSDQTMKVKEKSGFNAWNGASKNKGSSILRPEFEAYIPIPKWIHEIKPNFFGFNALNKVERDSATSFNLHLPDGRKVSAIVTQDYGKSLQTNPQRVLGKWILYDVLGLQARELLTMDHLITLGVDSLKLTKINKKNYKIELADMYAFEKWKIEVRELIESTCSRLPKIRKELFVDEDEEG